jgi:hypothetical protein
LRGVVKELEVQDPTFGGEGRAGVFAPDTLLPSQYFDRVRASREYDPERRLMFAILDLAVSDYIKTAGARDPDGQEHFREVEEWVEDRDPRWLYSFEGICNVLDLDIDYLRRGLRAWKQRSSGTGPDAKEPVVAMQHEEEGFRRASGA